MNKDKRRQILERLREANPHPTTELEYATPFELLISVILSAQATDISVNKATAKLYPHANTPETILALGVDGLKNYIKTIGLYNAKAENIIKKMKEKQHGDVDLYTHIKNIIYYVISNEVPNPYEMIEEISYKIKNGIQKVVDSGFFKESKSFSSAFKAWRDAIYDKYFKVRS